MGKPAARIGDGHVCPKSTPGTSPVPHVGGPVVGGCLTVLIEDRPAARVGDTCTCVGDPDKIKTGSSGVFIGGKPAARMGDQTVHGGVIMSGSGTVLIGMGKIIRVLPMPESEVIKELSPEEKVRAINEAIEQSIVLLERKLQLLEQNDYDTLEAFKRWFGRDDEVARGIILERTRKALEASNKLTAEKFSVIRNEKEKREQYANSYPNDREYKIYLGDKFWGKDTSGKKPKAGVIIHELSHFSDIGNTEDVIYGRERCLELAKKHPTFALCNAESFEYFISA